MIFVHLAKLAVIAFVAAVMASLVFAGLLILNGTLETILAPSFVVALTGSYLIGLPVALLVVQFAGAHMAQSPAVLVMIAALSSAMLVLASCAIGDRAAAYWLGLPSVAAVLTFAGLGWLWLVRPLQGARA